MRTSFDALDWALALLAMSALGSCVFLSWAAQHKRRSLDKRRLYQPPISILKPLCGVDEGLYENLVSFVEQRYPEYEIIFAVADPRDPALRVVAQLRAAYPDAPLRVLTHGEEDPGANPKVLSLLHMARAARYEHLLISDSNVRVRPEYLSAIAAEMSDPQVGLVSSVIVGAGDKSFGAQCENLHLNTFVVGGVCVADLAEKPCVVGKSMLMRRAELQKLGGFESLRDILAEDYVLGQRYHASGYRVVLSTFPITTYNQRIELRRFVSRHLRWAQLRRTCAVGPFMIEPLLYASPFLAAPLLHDPSQASMQSCALALMLRIALDAVCARRISGRWPAWNALLFIPVKDTLMLGVWCVALVSRSVQWRGHTLRIGTGSRLMPPAERAPSFRERLAAVWQ